jgi:hypothetical protein
MDLKGKHVLLCAVDITLLGENINLIDRNTDACASKEIGPHLKAEKEVQRRHTHVSSLEYKQIITCT